jgi:hypothetical protein
MIIKDKPTMLMSTLFQIRTIHVRRKREVDYSTVLIGILGGEGTAGFVLPLQPEPAHGTHHDSSISSEWAATDASCQKIMCGESMSTN